MSTQRAKSPAKAAFVVDGPARLSELLIWRLQREFYTQVGPRAWKPKGVPSFITNNAFIARAYARLAVGYMRDLLRVGALSPGQPLNVVELAGGAGRFAYLFLRALDEERAGMPSLAAVPVRYVLTDLVQGNLDAAREHERLRKYVEAGRFEVAHFDLVHDEEITIQGSGQRIGPGTLSPATMVLANYAFDSIPLDVYRVRAGALEHSLATAVSSRREETHDDPSLLERLRLEWKQVPLDTFPPYEDPTVNQVLRDYARLADTNVLIPVGAFHCLRVLLGWTGGRMLLVSGDKGFSMEHELANRGEPALGTHGGSFSFTVNFDAIGAYFKATGGHALMPTRGDYSFKVAAFLAGLDESEETRLAYRREIDTFGPGEYFHLSYTLRKQVAAPPLDMLLAAFKLGDWDPEMVAGCRQAVTQQAKASAPWMKEELARGLAHCWERFFPLHRNVAMELAWMAVAIERPRQAIFFGQESQRLWGESALALSVIGLAHATLGENALALGCAERALVLEPENPAALKLKNTVTEGLLEAARKAAARL